MLISPLRRDTPADVNPCEAVARAGVPSVLCCCDAGPLPTLTVVIAGGRDDVAPAPVGIRGYLGSMAGPNPNDEIRRLMLRYFYDRNAAATSKRGKRGSGVKISDVKKELKQRHALTQQQVMSNLTYLLDRSWVKEDEVKKEFTPGQGATTVESVTSFYEITAKGIDRIEGGSEFERASGTGRSTSRRPAPMSSPSVMATSSTPSSTTCEWSSTS